jgi:transcriptional regulator with XRE-family HTH domain
MYIDFGPQGDYIAHFQDRLKVAEISQAELARQTGIAPSQITRWFTRGMQPQVHNILVLEDGLAALLSAKKAAGKKAPKAKVGA